MSLSRLFNQLKLIVWGLALVPFLAAAEPVTQQSYYSIQLLSGSPELIRNTWYKAQSLPFTRIEKHGGQHKLRAGFWRSKKQAVNRLVLIKDNFPKAFLLKAEFEPNRIVQGWTVSTPGGRTKPLPLPSNFISWQEYAQPEILYFEDRHEIWVRKPLVRPIIKPFFPHSPIYSGYAKKQKVTPDEAPLWRLFNHKEYDALQAEIIRNRARYPNWRPPQRLLNLLTQEKTANKINLVIQEKDTAMLVHLAEVYPDAFTCSNIEWAWALAEAQARRNQSSSLILGLNRLIPGCSKQNRLATLYKAKDWLDTNQWEILLEREAQAQCTQQGKIRFRRLRFDHNTEKLLASYQSNDQTAFRTQLLQLTSEIEHYRDVDTALMGGWHYLDTHESTAAETWFNKALNWSPEQRDALHGLALSAKQDNRFHDAQQIARKLPAKSEVRQKILHDTAAAMGDMPSPTRIALAGAELNPGNSYAYVGAILPLHSRLGNGFVQRYWVDHLTYTFDRNGRKIDAEQWGAEVLFGYQGYHDRGSWAAYIGPVYRNIQSSPDVPNLSNRGGAFRGKIQLEGEQILSETWRVSGIASYVTGQNNYWVRGRLLHSINHRYAVGPEVITLGDKNFQILQFGWVILAAEVLPKTDVGVKFGVRRAKGQSATGYIGIELGRSF